MSSLVGLYHFHVKFPRGIGAAAAHPSVRFARDVLYLNIVFAVAFASAPKKEQNQAEQNHTQEGYETHSGGDD